MSPSASPAVAGRADPTDRAPEPTRNARKELERKHFTAALSAVDRFLSDFTTHLEYIVDPHNKNALTDLINRMAKDNVIRHALPKYVAGTGFATTLETLVTLNVSATNTCSLPMAKAANLVNPAADMPADRTTSTTTEATAGGRSNSGPSATPATDATANTIPPYLRAAYATPRPRPLTRLAPADSVAASPINTETIFATKLRRQAAAHMTDTWVGHETKNLMQVESDTPLATPTHLRQIMSFSGVRGSMAVLPTDDASKVMICATDSTLDAMEKSYDNFTVISRSTKRRPPTLQPCRPNVKQPGLSTGYQS